MGYSTDFEGGFVFSRTLSVNEQRTLTTFARERHESKDYPDYYCQWIPNGVGTALVWDGNEKFNCYVEWLRYLIDNFFVPWGIKLEGKVLFQGEDIKDRGNIEVFNNIVFVSHLP